MNKIYTENNKEYELKYNANLEKEYHNTDILVDKDLKNNIIFGKKYNNHVYYFGSRYNTMQSEKKALKRIGNINFQTIIVLMGLGCVNYIRELLKLLDNTNQVIIYEPDMDLFYEIMKNIDIRDIIKDKRVFIYVKGINEGKFVDKLLLRTNYSNLKYLKYIPLPNYDNLYIEEWKFIVKSIKDMSDSIMLSKNTEISFKGEMIGNMFRNYRDMAKQCILNQIKRELDKIDISSIPAILVSAGPSLDKNIEELRKAKGKAMIIAVDTALNSMDRMGIMPDMSVTVDPHKPVSLFQSETARNVPMIVSAFSNNEVVRYISGKRFYIGEMDYMSHIYTLYGKETPVQLETGGSVANTAFSVLQYLGFKKIMLVGQDLAYTNNKQHTSDAYNDVNNDINIQVDGINNMLVPAVGGGKVVTSKTLNSYNTWFENQIVRYPEFEVINATEGGAAKRGAREIKLKEAIEQYCNKTFEFDQLLDNISPVFSEDEANSIYEQFQNLDEKIDKCIERVEDGIKQYKKLYTLYCEKKSGSDEYAEVLMEIEDINKYTDSNPIMITASLYNAKDNYDVRSQVYEVKNDENDEIKQIRDLGIKVLESYVKALGRMKEDSVYMCKDDILQTIFLRLRELVRQLDTAQYYYERKDIQKYWQCYKNAIIQYEYINVVKNKNVDTIGKKAADILKLEDDELLAVQNKCEEDCYSLDIFIEKYSRILKRIIDEKLVYLPDMYKENMDVLDLIDVELETQINGYQMDEKSYISDITDRGYPNLVINGCYMYSNKDNVIINTKEQLENIDTNRDVLIFGIGLGYVFEELVQRGFGNNIFVLERDIKLIKHTLKHINLRAVFTTCKCKIIYDPDMIYFKYLLQRNNLTIIMFDKNSEALKLLECNSGANNVIIDYKVKDES